MTNKRKPRDGFTFASRASRGAGVSAENFAWEKVHASLLGAEQARCPMYCHCGAKTGVKVAPAGSCTAVPLPPVPLRFVSFHTVFSCVAIFLLVFNAFSSWNPEIRQSSVPTY